MHALTANLPAALAPGGALHALAQYRQFIVYRLSPRGTSGKLDKLPIDPRTGAVSNAHDPAIWLSADEAIAHADRLGADHGVGFVFTAADPFVFADLDNCLLPDNTWSPLAVELCTRLAGAAVEVSQSGRGLHIIGSAIAVPPHGCKNVPLGLELYHEGRFVALTGTHASGDAGADLTLPLMDVIDQYFPAPAAAPVTIVADGPRADYCGPTDDDELIALMLKGGAGAGAVFGGKATVANLWNADPQVLGRAYPDVSGGQGRAYDASSADAALASHLAFWTGGDVARIERLMRRSALARDKWDKHGSYLSRTILGAVARCDQVYTGGSERREGAPAVQIAPAQAPAAISVSFQANPETLQLLSRRSTRLIRFNGCWFTHEAGGFYRDLSEEVVRAEIRTSCDWPLKPAKINEVVDELKSAVIVDAHGVELPHWLEEVPGMPAPDDLIVCCNGILDPLTRRLHPHTGSLLTLNALPFNYSPDAPAPRRWLRFLDEVFGDDAEAVRELQKLAGYLLTLDTSLQKIFVFIGPKRSGKGTIARVFAALIGKDNVCGPSFNSIGGDFGLESCIGKQLATFPDARIGADTKKATVIERLLSISGEDALDISRKNRPAWYGKLSTRLVILSNEVPVLGDASGALASRYVVFNTPNSFYGREDRTLYETLIGEMPGILNWALDGLHQLRLDGAIVSPASAAELVADVENLGSPIKAFISERCEIGQSDYEVTKDALWHAYTQWHREEGIAGHPLSKEMFSRNLKTAFPGQVRDHRPSANTDEKRARRWRGVRLKPVTSPPSARLAAEVFASA
jgi:P4 family phage/plasmid primase-like protien